MQWPTLIVDDFFTNPHDIVKFSKTLKYTQAHDARWPGTRTDFLHKVDKDFFLWSTQKILTVLYPMNVPELKWQAGQHFQRIPHTTYGDEGWVHGDRNSEFTAIIYLSNHPQNGTCLYEGKHFNTSPKHGDERKRFFKELTDLKRMEKYREECNSKFRKKVELFSNFNRLVLFDGHHWHASRNFGEDKEDRLILITFFKSITCDNIRYPVTQMRRI